MLRNRIIKVRFFKASCKRQQIFWTVRKVFQKKFLWVFCVSDLEGSGRGLFDFGSFIFLLSFIFIFHLYKDS